MRISLLCATFIFLSLTPATRAQNVDPLIASQIYKAVGPHLTIVKLEAIQQSREMGSGTYLLVSVKPTRTGHFAFKYRYKYNQPLYSHVERELRMRVGKQGCRRGPLGYGRYSKFCLSDTIILPIVFNRFTEHEFSLVFTDEQVTDDVYADRIDPGSGSPDNPASEHLALVETSEYKSLHRAGGYTLKRSATFEARLPGRFNLSLASGSHPVIVVARDTPITALIGNDNVTGFTLGNNGQEYVSSTGGNDNYLTNVLILQTGDRYSFQYESIIYSARAEFSGAKPPEKAGPPKIQMLPFTFDSNWSYNVWIKNYLP
jgi:hypothetical protein